MNIRCYVIDDQLFAAEIIRGFIEQMPGLEFVGMSDNPVETLQKIKDGVIDVDLVFVDIQMPKLSGIAFVELLPDNVKAIFTTAHLNFAVEAFQTGAIGYLTKPVTYSHFERCIQKAMRFFNEPKAKATDHELNYLFIPGNGKGRLIRIEKSSITYVEGALNYVTIYTDKRKFALHTSIKKIADELGTSEFKRIHKSYIVRLDKIDYVDGNEVYLNDKTSVFIGPKYRKDFLAMLTYNSGKNNAPNKPG